MDRNIYDNSLDIKQLDGLNTSISSVNSSSYSTSDLTSSSDESFPDLSSSCSSSSDDLSDCDNQSSSAEEDEYFEIPVIVNIFRDNCHNSPAPVWYEPVHNQKKPRIPVRKTIRRDNRLAKSSQLPVISVSNLRSLMPKVKIFAEDMHQRNIGVALLTEVWEKAQKKKHIFEIDRMLHMEGLKYISTPRSTAKRGGGAAIVAPILR